MTPNNLYLNTGWMTSLLQPDLKRFRLLSGCYVSSTNFLPSLPAMNALPTKHIYLCVSVKFLPTPGGQTGSAPAQKHWGSGCASSVWPAGGRVTNTHC